MRVLLINPSVRPEAPVLMFNVGLVYIAGALKRAGHELKVLDIDAYRWSEEETLARASAMECDVICIGTLVSKYAWLKRTVAALKKAHPKAPIIVGNTLGTSVPHIVCSKTATDICVLGEGEVTIVELLEAIASGKDLSTVAGIAYRDADGKVVKTPEREVVADIDTIPFPDYDIFETERYIKKSHLHVSGWEFIKAERHEIVALPVNTARGCPFHCSFCYHAFQEKQYRHRSPANICDEIELLQKKYKGGYKAMHVDFWDELTFYSAKTTEQFLDMIVDRGLKFSWLASMRADLLSRQKPERARAVIKKFAAAGAIGASYAMESGNAEILTAMNKLNTTDDFIKQTKYFHEAGLPVYASIVLGYPQETEKTIAETFAVLKEARVYPSVGFLQPMPGTPMHAQAMSMGLIKDEEQYLLGMGDRQDLRVNMTGMDPDHMQEVVKKHLIALNRDLNMGLAEDRLIKTGIYRADKSTVDTFLTGFGVSADVLRAAAAGEKPGSC